MLVRLETREETRWLHGEQRMVSAAGWIRGTSNSSAAAARQMQPWCPDLQPHSQGEPRTAAAGGTASSRWGNGLESSIVGFMRILGMKRTEDGRS